MEIKFEKCLRDILAKCGRTQRELAEHLSISTQAVSKWCRGENMPDIALLPKIAFFLDVSVDELLGVEEVRKQEKIKMYNEKSEILLKSRCCDENLKLWREAQHEFPNEVEVLYHLMYALGEIEGDNARERIELCEKILEQSTCQKYRDGAIQFLCLDYNRQGEKDKAREYAEMAGGLWVSSEVLLEHVLEGEEFAKHCRMMFVEYLDLLYVSVMTYIHKSDRELQIKLAEWYIKLLDVYFDDGFLGSYAKYAADLHSSLASLYTGVKKDEAKAREHLEAANDNAFNYDALPEKYTYGCTLLDGYESSLRCVGNQPTASEALLDDMQNNMFDPWRHKDWFKAIVEELKAKNS